MIASLTLVLLSMPANLATAKSHPEWTSDRLTAALHRGKTAKVFLSRPIRVYTVYGTSLATEAGESLFFDDIYDQDARLTALLASRRERLQAS